MDKKNKELIILLMQGLNLSQRLLGKLAAGKEISDEDLELLKKSNKNILHQLHGEEEKDWELKINRYLKSLKVPQHLVGFNQLVFAIKYGCENEIKSFSNDLYPIIAEEFGTTPSRVERNIRHAKEASWKKLSPKEKEEILGYETDKAMIPNVMFIKVIINNLKFGI